MKSNQKYKKPALIPRSILRISEKFKHILEPDAEARVIEEFRVSRQRTVSSIRSLLILITVPLLVNQLSKIFVINPLIDKFWKQEQVEIFLNSSQEEKALAEFKRFQKQLRFEVLLGKTPKLSTNVVEKKLEEKAIGLVQKYKTKSTNAIANIIADILSLLMFILLCIIGKQQITTLKLFADDLFYELSDSAKAFLIILSTDIFVGYHSAYGWEIVVENILSHFGLPENKSLISLFIATVPVVMDTIFKYWIFRYLNRSSPSAVATYRNMNE